MSSLVSLKGPQIGQRYPLEGERLIVGRQPDADVFLESLAVSRQHACILVHENGYVIEDLKSSNGTFLNGQRVTQPMPLTERDTLEIGPYTLALRPDPAVNLTDTQQVIRARVDASSSNQTLLAQTPTHKLQMVLEIVRNLGRSLDLDPLLGELLDRLFRLFPQADRGMVMLCERDRQAVRAQRTRQQGSAGDYRYSRTVVRRALDEGVGLLSEDVGDDPHMLLSNTLVSLNLRSFLCVPLLGAQERRLGVIQLDCLRPGQVFRPDDLETLTALGRQVAAVIENVSLHAERLREARLRQELLLAREIQQSFLPTDFTDLLDKGVELFARVHPAREVSGDLYDFFRLADGRLAFFLGDVSGKGMPAALFMIAVRTLLRHLAPSASSPADLLRRLHAALVADNPTAMFVTLAHGVFDPTDGSLLFSSAGHPPPLLRRSDGSVEVVTVHRTQMLGNSMLDPVLKDTRLRLALDETFVLYSDGYTEAFAPGGKEMFGVDRLREILGGARTQLSLEGCAEEVTAAVARHSGEGELQDDQTLLLLRRQEALSEVGLRR